MSRRLRASCYLHHHAKWFGSGRKIRCRYRNGALKGRGGKQTGEKALKGAADTSEMFVHIYQIALRHMPESSSFIFTVMKNVRLTI
jgi:hypothetical protein